MNSNAVIAAVVVVALVTGVYFNRSTELTPIPVALQAHVSASDYCQITVNPKELNATVYDDVNEIRFGFTVDNPSAVPVRILEIVPSCSCTTGKLSVDTVPPHGQATFDVRYNVTSHFGELPVRVVRIVTDSPECTELFCQVGGKRLRRFEITPATLDFGKVQAGEVQSKSVTISGVDVDFAVTQIASSNPSVMIRNVNMSHDSRGVQTVELIAEFKAGVGAGTFEAVLILPQKHAGAPSAIVPIRAMINGPVSAQPPAAFLGIVQAKDSPKSVIKIHTSSLQPGHFPIQLLEVVESPPTLQCEVSKETSEVLIRPKWQDIRPGAFSEKIAVRCVVNGEEYRISIPVHALIR